jgi:hypothetical protein
MELAHRTQSQRIIATGDMALFDAYCNIFDFKTRQKTAETAAFFTSAL